MVYGADFGTFETCSRGRFGFTASTSTLWTSDSAVAGAISSGSSQSLDAVITVGRPIDTVSQAVSYDIPSMALVSIREGDEINNSVAGVSGVNFGTGDLSVQMRIRGSAAKASAWTSDTSISCRWISSCGVSAGLSATVALLTNTLSASFTYNSLGLLPGKQDCTTGPCDFSVAIFTPTPAQTRTSESERTVWLSTSTVVVNPSLRRDGN
eukprot:1787412-Rhodomonas_salina.1